MKLLHKPNLYGWSVFNEERNLDFNSVFWRRPQGNVAIDPLELSAHDQLHVAALGGIQEIIVTNSDHLRATAKLAATSRARVWAPALEHAAFESVGAAGLKDGEEPWAGLEILTLHGSKTPGELALLLEGDTLVVGDLVRGHAAGRLNFLPDAKLANKAQALASLRRLAALTQVEAVLVGDGWPVFRGGKAALQALAVELGAA
jgi:metallo-beta-lactamase superfamily protein